MRRSVIGPIIGAVLTLGVLGVVGYGVYQAGYKAGLAETATEVIVNRAPFYPGFGLFFGFIFLLFFFGFINRLFFWGRWRRGWYGPRGWSSEEGSPMERRLAEWHEQAHEGGERRYRSDSPDTG